MLANGRWPYCDPRWPKLRTAVRIRDGYACTLCHQPARILDVDHIQPWATHPHLAFDPTNLRTLCRRCHNRKTHGPTPPRRTTRNW